MKVHIAYDDGTLVGVYRKRKQAKKELDDKAFGSASVGTVTDWWPGAEGIERAYTIHNGHHDQWIDTYEVTK